MSVMKTEKEEMKDERPFTRMSWAEFKAYAVKVGWEDVTLNLLMKGNYKPNNPLACGKYFVEIAT